ncbi:MAG: hypothetical protein IJW69_01090 [Clostridia bacterium]|nr:hypothetical protein [Clostridia bacterium]
MKKLLALLLVVLSLLGPMAIGASAATTSYSPFVCGSTSQPYTMASKTKIYGQKMVEKAITVKKGKTKTIKAAIGTGTKYLYSGKMTKYVRFAVWVYDCATKQRVAVGDIKVGETYKLPVNKKAAKTYSVQLRPYISTSAWSAFTLSDINAYVKTAQFCMVY